MDKILVVATGGTIACTKDESIHLDRPFKILDYVKVENTEFECASPFVILSENMNFEYWQRLIDFVSAIDFEKYKGVILLHGSDTLGFTAALLGNAFYDKPIVLTASDKPPEDESSNAVKNFETAVEKIAGGIDGVCVSYDGFHRAVKGERIESPCFAPKNVLVINPYVNIDYENYNLDNVDAVLHSMYHSATAPQNVTDFIEKCALRGIPFYFVTENGIADYESAKNFENIIFNSTVEDAFSKMLLTK